MTSLHHTSWKVLRIVTVNGECYREMISYFFARNARASLAWHVVSTRNHLPHSTRNNGPIERRVRWTFYFTFGVGQLAVFRLFLWGYVYTDKPASIEALEDNFEAFIREIPAEMLEGVRQNWTKRLEKGIWNGDPWKSKDQIEEVWCYTSIEGLLLIIKAIL